MTDPSLTSPSLPHHPDFPNPVWVGTVVNVHGIRGGIKLLTREADPQWIEEIESILLTSSNGESTMWLIEKVHQQNPTLFVLHLKGLKYRDQAEALRHFEAYVNESSLGELDEVAQVLYHAVGMDVLSAHTGHHWGTILDLLSSSRGNNDFLEITLTPGPTRQADHPEAPWPTAIIPIQPAFIESLDLEERKITLKGLDDFLAESADAPPATPKKEKPYKKPGKKQRKNCQKSSKNGQKVPENGQKTAKNDEKTADFHPNQDPVV